jgi:hypothetical protein
MVAHERPPPRRASTDHRARKRCNKCSTGGLERSRQGGQSRHSHAQSGIIPGCRTATAARKYQQPINGRTRLGQAQAASQPPKCSPFSPLSPSAASVSPAQSLRFGALHVDWGSHGAQAGAALCPFRGAKAGDDPDVGGRGATSTAGCTAHFDGRNP